MCLLCIGQKLVSQDIYSESEFVKLSEATLCGILLQSVEKSIRDSPRLVLQLIERFDLLAG